jgi:hypothetical protein
MSKHWTVPREWDGKTAFLVAGGTSVESQNLGLLRGHRVLAINSSYEAVPFADFLYFGDNRWYVEHARKREFWAFKGRIVTACQACEHPRLLKLRRVVPNTDPAKGTLGPGLSAQMNAVVSSRTSTQGALNMLVHLGVRRIGLLGVDMCRAADGHTHHHLPHKWKNKPGNRTWDIQMTQLQLVVEPLKKLGIEVVNLSPISRLDWWPKMTLESFLASLVEGEPSTDAMSSDPDSGVVPCQPQKAVRRRTFARPLPQQDRAQLTRMLRNRQKLRTVPRSM